MSCTWVNDERPRAPTLTTWMRGCMSATTRVFGAAGAASPADQVPGSRSSRSGIVVRLTLPRITGSSQLRV